MSRVSTRAGSQTLERQGGVLKLRLFASEIFLLSDQALKNGKVFGTGIHGEVGGQNVLLQIQDHKRCVLKSPASKDLIALALVAGELEMKIEDVRPDVSQEIVGLAGSCHILSGQLPAIFGMAPMLHSPALSEQGIPIAGDIPAGINVGVGGLDRKSTRLNSSHITISY